MILVNIRGYVFDAEKFIYAETTGQGVSIHLRDAKDSLSIRTRTGIQAQEKLREIQKIISEATCKDGR